MTASIYTAIVVDLSSEQEIDWQALEQLPSWTKIVQIERTTFKQSTIGELLAIDYPLPDCSDDDIAF